MLRAPGAQIRQHPVDLDDRRRDLEQMILTAGRSIKNLNSVADARKELESSRAEDADPHALAPSLPAP